MCHVLKYCSMIEPHCTMQWIWLIYTVHQTLPFCCRSGSGLQDYSGTQTLSNINKMPYFYTVCTVCVTTFSTSGEIPPGFKLHALTQVARSYAHLLAITQLHAHSHHEFWHVHIRNIKKPRLY